MFDLLPFLIEQLQSPDYLHLVLLPLLVQGLLLSSIMVIACVVLKQRRALAVALLLTGACAGTAYPYLKARTAAVSAIQLAQDKHLGTEIQGYTIAFEKIAWIYYALAGIALLGAITSPLKNKLSPMLGLLTFIWSIYAAGLALAYHHRDERIYHPNLEAPESAPRPPKPTPPPSPKKPSAPTSTPDATAIPDA